MRRFLKDSLGVILAFVMIIATCEIVFYIIPNTYSYKYKYVFSHKEDISVLILGHSHTLRGVNPKLLGDSAFNFAESARWIYYDAKIVERLVPKMPNLRLVIYPIGYDMPFGYLSYHYEDDYNTEDQHDYNIHMYAKYQNIPYDRFPMCYTAYSTFLSGFLAKDEIDFHFQMDCDSLGFEILDSLLHSDNWKVANIVHVPIDQIEADCSDNIYVQEYIKHLTTIAKVCAENHVRFVTITTPCYETYVEKTSEAGWRNIYSIIEQVRKLYPIEYFNYLADEEFRADSLYLDCSHLNYIGADKFTPRLKQDLGL